MEPAAGGHWQKGDRGNLRMLGWRAATPWHLVFAISLTGLGEEAGAQGVIGWSTVILIPNTTVDHPIMY